MKKIIAALGLATVLVASSVSADAQYYSTTQTRPAWSHRATGAAVGAGSGAIIGAILNKQDPAAGAAIGTLIGAGAGYLIGQREDRVNPRPRYVQKRTVYDQYGQVVSQQTRRTNKPGRRYNNGYSNGGYYNNGYNTNGYNNNGYYTRYR
jgi:phage tail tape-measure protein